MTQHGLYRCVVFVRPKIDADSAGSNPATIQPFQATQIPDFGVQQRLSSVYVPAGIPNVVSNGNTWIEGGVWSLKDNLKALMKVF